MTFYDVKKQYSGIDFEKLSDSFNPNDIGKILDAPSLRDEDFPALLSPAALPHLEKAAQKAHQITVDNFGKSILLYAPLYVSNFCINNCAYCGFSSSNKIERRVLTFDEIEENAKIIAGFGIGHILLLTGESRVKTPMDYLKKTVELLKKYFDCIDIEIFPLEQKEYAELFDCGVTGLTIYQETYDEELYKTLHTQGAKSDYRYRLETCERAGAAGFRNLNIGALLGLNDFVSELFFAAMHAKYLQKTFPSAEIGMSFPRLRPAAGSYKPKTIISDKNLAQAICACRIFMPRLNIAVSTRESAELRNNILPLGITKMSAGSRTDVGGYVKEGEGQFQVNDSASVKEVKEMIYQSGYQPILKDWLLI